MTTTTTTTTTTKTYNFKYTTITSVIFPQKHTSKQQRLKEIEDD